MADDALDLDEVAALFSVTEKAVRGWVAAGMPVITKGSQGGSRNKTTISLKEAVEWYFHENYERLELDRARTRLADEQAIKVALENAVRSKDLVVLEVYEREHQKDLSELRSAFLAFPVKLAPVLDGDVNRRKDTLERAVHELLQRLAHPASDGDREGLSGAAPDLAHDSGAATETDRKRVGRPKKKAVRRKQRRAGPVAD